MFAVQSMNWQKIYILLPIIYLHLPIIVSCDLSKATGPSLLHSSREYGYFTLQRGMARRQQANHVSVCNASWEFIWRLSHSPLLLLVLG